MNINIYYKGIQKYVLIFVFFIAVFLFSCIVKHSKVYAAGINWNAIPFDIQQNLINYDDNTEPGGAISQCYQSPPWYQSEWSWLSTGGSNNDAAYQPISTPPGSTSVSVQLNNMDFLCHPAVQGDLQLTPADANSPSNPGANAPPVVPSSSPIPSPPATQSGLYLSENTSVYVNNVKTEQVNCTNYNQVLVNNYGSTTGLIGSHILNPYNPNYRYWFANVINFSWNAPGAGVTSKTCIGIVATETAINTFDPGGITEYACVARNPGEPANASTLATGSDPATAVQKNTYSDGTLNPYGGQLCPPANTSELAMIVEPSASSGNIDGININNAGGAALTGASVSVSPDPAGVQSPQPNPPSSGSSFFFDGMPSGKYTISASPPPGYSVYGYEYCQDSSGNCNPYSAASPGYTRVTGGSTSAVINLVSGDTVQMRWLYVAGVAQCSLAYLTQTNTGKATAPSSQTQSVTYTNYTYDSVTKKWVKQSKTANVTENYQNMSVTYKFTHVGTSGSVPLYPNNPTDPQPNPEYFTAGAYEGFDDVSFSGTANYSGTYTYTDSTGKIQTAKATSTAPVTVTPSSLSPCVLGTPACVSLYQGYGSYEGTGRQFNDMPLSISGYQIGADGALPSSAAGDSYDVSVPSNVYPGNGSTTDQFDNSTYSGGEITYSPTWYATNPGDYTLSWELSGPGVPSTTPDPCSGVLYVGNQPYVQVNGGDVMAGSQFPNISETPTLTPSGVGGGLSTNTTYYYLVTAVLPGGQTSSTPEVNANTGSDTSMTVTWPTIANATSYRVYRGTASNAENAYYPVGAAQNSFTDTGTAATSGAPPALNVACTTPGAGISAWNNNDTTLKTNYNDGAGGEFAVQAVGPIDGFASAQNGSATPPIGLSFANTGVPQPNPNFLASGSFGAAPCAYDYWQYSANASSDLGSSLDSYPTGSYLFNHNKIVNGSGLKAGQQVTLYVNGNLYISKNLNFQGASSPVGSTDPNNLTSLHIIVKGNIYIDSNVTQLSGEYIAQGGTIYDCSDSSGNFEGVTSCNNRLTVNGAFVASNIEFQRTGGTMGDTGLSSCPTDIDNLSINPPCHGPAEIFNYSPYVWLARPTTPASDQFDAVTNLPPVL